MPFWFNNEKARARLLAHGKVYTLREKPYQGTAKAKKLVGYDVLMYDVEANRGRVYFTFVKTIKDDAELREYLPLSGFPTIEEWLEAAGNDRNLYAVELAERMVNPP